MQRFQLRLNLLGTLLSAIAGFQILLQFHDFSRNGCDLQLPLHDRSLVSGADRPFQLVPQVGALGGQSRDLMTDPLPISIQICGGLDLILRQEPGLRIQPVQLPQVLPHSGGEPRRRSRKGTRMCSS